jgi:hypothetical protein
MPALCHCFARPAAIRTLLSFTVLVLDLVELVLDKAWPLRLYDQFASKSGEYDYEYEYDYDSDEQCQQLLLRTHRKSRK